MFNSSYLLYWWRHLQFFGSCPKRHPKRKVCSCKKTWNKNYNLLNSFYKMMIYCVQPSSKFTANIWYAFKNSLSLFRNKKFLLETFDLTVVESLMLEIPEKFFLQNSPGLPFSMYIIMVRRKNALKNKITEKTEFVYF